MNAVTVSEAKKHLEQLIHQVLADAEPMIVVTDAGERVVVLPLDEFNAWHETLYLVANPANAVLLRHSITVFEAGQGLERVLIEE